MTEGNGNYTNDPVYSEILSHFQKGEWEAGHIKLNGLLEQYPLEPELRGFRQEMQLRAYMDTYEKEDKKGARRKKSRKFLTRAILIVALVALFFWGFETYSSWMNSRVNSAQAIVAEEFRTYTLKSKFDSVQQYLASYRATEAKAILEEIAAEDPEYPGIAELKQTADQIEALNQQYDQAMALKAEGDLNGALAILEGMPGYRDVSLQIREIQRSYDLSDMVRIADEAVLAGDWLTAIEKYEDVRNRDALYLREEIENRLYNSYINAAKAILEEQPDSLEALQEAREYFSKALTLRPQDTRVVEEMDVARQSVALRLFNKYIEMAQNALVDQADSLTALATAEEYFAQAQQVIPDDANLTLQRRLAQGFIQAQADFKEQKWDAVIQNLGYVYENDPDFAGGTARQALYDALIARGDSQMITGRPQSAFQDYTNALLIAQLRPDGIMRLFESQVRLGNSLGLIGNYETAVYQYRAALEEFELLETSIFSPEVQKALNSADSLFLRRRYKQSYNAYNETLGEMVKNFQTVSHTVTTEDYLSRLANFYQTTVSAILEANGISDPKNLSIGDKIIIPVIP
jgi:tetratricopeptide (TPR) repeat protein